MKRKVVIGRMKPIKVKELLKTVKDPSTQRIIIDEGFGFDTPLFDGVVEDVDETLGERVISNWRPDWRPKNGTCLVVSSNPSK